ncbi:MAG: SH3 domain-containing protein, partial [Anaerolineales bacterium]
MRNGKRVSLLLLLWIGILGCHIPRAAQVREGSPTPLVTVTLLPAASPTVSLLPTFTLVPPSPSPTVAATPSLLLADATRCREGPGQTFPIVTVVPAGAQLPLLGEWGGEYWLVRLENGKVCWLWGGAATPQGNLLLLPSVTPLPTSTLAAPTTPQNLRYTYSCEYASGSIQVTVSLSWNETPR